MKVVRLRINPSSREDYWAMFFGDAVKHGRIPQSEIDYFRANLYSDFDPDYGSVTILSVPQGKFVEFWMKYYFTLPDNVMCYLDGDKSKPCYF